MSIRRARDNQDDDEPVSLDIHQWVLQEIGLLHEFAQDWIARHRRDAHDWPLTLTADVWDEQFWLFHMGVVEGEDDDEDSDDHKGGV